MVVVEPLWCHACRVVLPWTNHSFIFILSFESMTLLKNSLLRSGKASAELREEMVTWTEWLGNESPPWAAYRALMGRRDVVLDKETKFRLLGSGNSTSDAWRSVPYQMQRRTPKQLVGANNFVIAHSYEIGRASYE